MYEPIFTKKSEKDFDSLTDELKHRVIGVLERIKINPKKYLKKLAGTNLYRLRIGDYRVILDIDEKNKKLVCVRIGHRRNIYR